MKNGLNCDAQPQLVSGTCPMGPVKCTCRPANYIPAFCLQVEDAGQRLWGMYIQQRTWGSPEGWNCGPSWATANASVPFPYASDSSTINTAFCQYSQLNTGSEHHLIAELFMRMPEHHIDGLQSWYWLFLCKNLMTSAPPSPPPPPPPGLGMHA